MTTYKSSRNLIKLATSIFIAVLVSINAPLAGNASSPWGSLSIDAQNEWAAVGQVTNISAVTISGDASNGTPLTSANVQLYGFANPLSGGAPTAVTSGNSVVITDGSFEVKITATGQSLSVIDTSVSWVPAFGPLPDHLVVTTNLASFNSVVEFEFAANALSTDPTATSRRIAFIGSTGISGDFRAGFRNYFSGGSTPDSVPAPTPAKYSGPEFSALSSKLVTVGSSSVLEGKRLKEVSSITIGGKSATFTATATELKLDVPTLAPGIYDLVIQSAAGKLTHMNAVRVQAPRRSLSITTVAEGRVTQNQFAEHALIASMQPRDLNRVRCIVNGPNLAAARAQAEQLCAAVRSANRHIETSIVEPRSTVRDNKVYARVTYGWN